ncbi:MAG TPA: PhzF family phenazine biosynthesis isomerase [Micromonosporaceae bacterium]
MNACLRNGRGGSPTAVLDEAALSDSERRRVPVLMGTSHAVFVSVDAVGEAARERPLVSLRFFTAAGELPACGHGTVAALAALAERAGADRYQATVRTPGRVFAGWSERKTAQRTAAFDPGPVELREATVSERDAVAPALGLTPATLAPGTCVASVGRERLLVPVSTRSALVALAPDFDRLRATCDRFGFLGCYVYTAPTPEGGVAARMFAPSIGVPEDIANANSVACLAARLAGRGAVDLTVDMGDSLGSPSTITATAQPGPSGTRISLAGAAAITHVVSLTL